MKKLSKTGRVLSILYRLMRGEKIAIQDCAEEYEVSTKSIQRDISAIRSFLSEYRELTGDLELRCNKQEHSYRLSSQDMVQARDLLLILKVLLGSRALDKLSLNSLLGRLAAYNTKEQQEFLRESCKRELDGYYPVGKDTYSVVAERMWLLEETIRSGHTVRIVYERLDGERVERILYPIATQFDRFYFYLLACRADKEDRKVIYYRIDRICEAEPLEERIPIGLEDRRKLELVKQYNQNMFMGKHTRIRFLYTGPSVEAILDKFAAAEVVKQDENGAEITAQVEYSRGTLMELLGQGSWVKVLAPKQLVEDMKKELDAIKGNYKT
ncbi:MAG: WYL domain-containing protein [Lachnospiraceae bacterium]|nr:WYL domain-containing protein [Lachnospiraceae bacterium]